MKKILLTLILGMFLISLVSAQDGTEHGITPDNRFLYGIDIALEKIRMAFTFGNENKVNYGLKIAEERLAELLNEKEKKQLSIENLNKIEQNRVKILEDVKERVQSDEAKEIIQNVIEGTDKGVGLRDKIQTAIDNSQKSKDKTIY